MTEIEECCGNCDYWRGDVDAMGCSDCRRYPPTIPLVEYVTDEGVEVHLTSSGGDMVYTHWPRTDAEDRCGEWAPDRETRLEAGL